MDNQCIPTYTKPRLMLQMALQAPVLNTACGGGKK